jgi:aryl-alcohol dehydrogenase
VQIEAAVLRSVEGPYRLESLTLREPGPGEMLVRIVGSGWCHTDTLPRSALLAAPPIVTGHEGAGVVEALGPGVDGFAVGDHVVLSFDSCGACTNCRAAHPAYCETFIARNLTGFELTGATPVTDEHGEAVAARWFGQSSFATHTLATPRNAVKVDADLPLELLGPLGCSVQTGAGSVLLVLGVAAGSSLVVIGAGAVGLSAVMAARVAGAATIVAVDVQPARLALAEELGATHTFDGRRDDLLAALHDATGGGAQHSFDTTGVPSVIATAVQALRPTGTCGLVGIQQGDLVLDPFTLSLGRTVMGIFEGDAVPQVFIPRLIALWRQGRFPFDRLVEVVPLDQVNEAERASAAGEMVKPVLAPPS